MKWITTLITVMSFLCVTAFAQSRTVTGNITDAKDGTPVANVTIKVKGTSIATQTDVSGNYSITVTGNVVLVFSSVGYADQEVAVKNNTQINVQLQATQNSLQEVVVTGYAVQNKRQVAGSIAKLSGDAVKMQPIGSFDQVLQGKVPGLLSQSQSGQPGAAATVTIRGKGSIVGSNDPLYIIDGIEVTAADFATINPSDFESFNVLKDASSTSIFGSRGANGVIVITTKKGSAGKTKVNYDIQYGESRLPENKLKLMNSAQKLDYEVNYDRPYYGKNPFGWTTEQIDSLSKIDNHLDEIIFKKGRTQQHQLSVSGGNDKTKFYLSGSIFDQQGVVISTGLKRYTGRANIETVFGNFKVGLNTSFGYSKLTNTNENDQYIGSPLNAIRWFNPYVTIYDAQGNYQDDDIQGQPNPVRELVLNPSSNDQLKGVGNTYIEYAFPTIKGLRLKTLWGIDFTENNVSQYLDRTSYSGQQSTGGEGQLKRAYSRIFRYTGTSSINYQRTFGDHFISASVFNEIIQAKSQAFGYTGFGLIGPFKNEAGITPGTPANGFIPIVNGDAQTNSLLSYFFDATYGYKNRYFINAGGRRDGSSRFGVNNKYANFGQVGFSWIMSDENFLANSKNWLSQLKFKISYGSVGNQLGIGNFASRELYDATVYNGVPGLILTNLANANLQWEKKLMFNTGFEFALFKGIVTGTAEYYNNITKDLFLNKQLSRTSGFTFINTNLGKLQNQGIELSVNVDVIKSRSFNWSLSANYTYNKNKILDQGGQDENINGLYINKVGKQANSLYVVRYAGVDAQTGDALYYTKDGKSTTKTYDPSDAVIVGTVDPPHFGGFSTSVSYKGIALDVLFSYSWGNVIYNNDRFNVEYPAYWYSRLSVNMLREWQKPGDKTDVPSPFSDFHAETSRFVEKGNYLRLRNVMLSYSLPTTLLNKWKINSLRVFVQGQNLHVWSKFLGFDPEITTGILGGAQYPQLKNITAGLNIGL